MRKGLSALASALAATLLFPASVAAHHELPEEAAGALEEVATAAGPLPDLYSPQDEHSPNMSLISNFDDGGIYRQGADEAFWGHHAILSSYDNPGGFRIVDIKNPRRPAEVGQFVCAGSQADVSVWQHLVFVSVDSPRTAPECGSGSANASRTVPGTAWEGIRVVDISDPANPTQVAAVRTDCGSHTNTLVPDTSNGHVLVYALSYPLNPQGANCNPATHRKFSIVKVPLANPAAAHVASTPDVSPAIGCHDVTVHPAIGLAGAACLTESQLWDISDPANPRIVSHIRNPLINLHHSSTFSWDGNTLVIGDELAGAAGTPGCPEGADQHLPLGALWFYDVSDPANPAVKGSFKIPQGEGDSLLCTAHNFNTVPLRGDRDVLVSGWYNGGTTVVDFTDPSTPEQLGYYIAHGPTQNSGTEARPDETVRSTAWSSHFYNGYIYANNFDEDVHSLSPISRGMDVFQIDHPALKHSLRVPYLNPQTMLPARGQRQSKER